MTLLLYGVFLYTQTIRHRDYFINDPADASTEGSQLSNRMLALSTAFDGAMPFATSDLHIRYLEPAKGEVVGEGKVIRFSGRGAILECRLTCGDHLVALATANFAIKHGLGG